MPEGAELYALDKLPTSCIIHPELSTENWKLRRKIARVFFFLTIKHALYIKNNVLSKM